MSNERQQIAFLIRWQDDGPHTRWRSTVENAYTGQKLTFMSKRDLLRFMWQSLYEGEMRDPTGANSPEET